MKLKQIIIILCLLAVGLSSTADKNSDHNYSVTRNMEIFSSIYKHLDMMYVDTLDADVTVGAGIRAMLRSLDPYTEYYPPEEVKDLKTLLTGKYAGIGALIKHDMRNECVIIDEPYEGMPAAEAGLKKGDVIVAVDDTLMKGKTVSEVSAMLRGEPGTSFILKIQRPQPLSGKSKTMKIKVTRRSIQLPCVPYYGLLPQSGDEKVGYLLLTQFTDDCARDVRRALVDMRSQGMKSLIFDLRDNGGGSLNEAVKIVNMFVRKGETIVNTRGKLKRSFNEYKTTSEPLDTVMPIVMLVNRNTASASEITAGSLQDLDRAVILGTRTYGKGLVQIPVDLPHDASLKVTISKYYIPSGRCIQAINYKHTGGGYKENIPDSLTHEFKTRGGRTVRDGGGIKPDVEMKGDSLASITAGLFSTGADSTEVVTQYVVNYVAKHPTIAAPSEFRLTDADYDEFKAMVIGSGFKYDLGTGKMFDELVKVAQIEGRYSEAQAEFDALKAKLSNNLPADLDRHREVIQSLLEENIVTCYYYQRGAAESMLKYDKQVARALELLKDKEEYGKLLSK
ncbi:MAG: S41 family peptidase [Prevotella sp.]|nr:S41 family peptidase [Prevotella sp.]